MSQMSVLIDRCNVTLIESKRKWLKNSRDRLDYLEVPYLLIVLLYNISSIISSLLILYIVDKETGKYFLNQVWLSLAAVNKFNQEWNWIILDMKYTSVPRVAGHTKKFVFQWFNSFYRPFVFRLCIILYNFLVCKILLNLYFIQMFYFVSVRLYIAMSGFNVRLVNV